MNLLALFVQAVEVDQTEVTVWHRIASLALALNCLPLAQHSYLEVS